MKIHMCFITYKTLITALISFGFLPRNIMSFENLFTKVRISKKEVPKNSASTHHKMRALSCDRCPK